jgi:hypothetical protein
MQHVKNQQNYLEFCPKPELQEQMNATLATVCPYRGYKKRVFVQIFKKTVSKSKNS